jgi:hypothetical protein
MLDTKSIELYEGRSLADVFREIEERGATKRNRIEGLIDRLVDMVDDPNKAVVLVPLIKEYLEIDNTNDKHLIELAKIIEKLYKTKVKEDDSVGAGELTGAEKDWLRDLADEEDEDAEGDAAIDASDPQLDALEGKTEKALAEIDQMEDE